MREALWSAVAAATAFSLPLREGRFVDKRRKAVAAATALQGAFGTASDAGGDTRTTTGGDMKRTWKVFSLLIAVCLVAISIHVQRATGQTLTATSPAGASNDQARLAVNIIRVINTAEVVDCREKGGNIDENEKFLTWDELLNAPCFKQAQSHFRGFNELSLSSGPEIVPGIELRLVVSGKHYNLWLGQKREVNCGFAFFSDERGVIYEGKAIGCSAQGVLGKP
jgi:hypothetical protein